MQPLARLRANMESVFFGRKSAITQVLVGLVARGHVLIEDVPGVGKTVLARSLARSINCNFNRIQLTPDMLPSDILGVSVYNQDTKSFDFKPGPIFANVILADEINRTTPRTQSSLLEAMNEFSVTVDGNTMPLPAPFMVIATQNPFEFEGTYLLPENQLDRFLLRVSLGYPERDREKEILRRQPGRYLLDHLDPVLSTDEVKTLQGQAAQVKFDPALLDYLMDLVEATRTDELLHIGISPRGSLALMQASQALALVEGRDYVTPDDIKHMVVPVCAHRVITKNPMATAISPRPPVPSPKSSPAPPAPSETNLQQHLEIKL
jgi:MoxR-like ATPase